MFPYAQLLQAVKENQQIQIFTLVATPENHKACVGEVLLVYPNGEQQGCLIDEEFTSNLLNGIKVANWNKPQLIELSNSQYKIFWDQVKSNPQAIVFGGGHISQPLVEMLSLIGYQVTVVDDRPEFANTDRFPKAFRVVCNSFSRAQLELVIDNNTAVILMTRGHRYDLECLRATINSPACYIGMIGSRRRVQGIMDILLQEGVALEKLHRLRAPIGLDIGAQTPAEIALSVAAEVLAVVKGGDGIPLSRKSACG